MPIQLKKPKGQVQEVAPQVQVVKPVKKVAEALVQEQTQDQTLITRVDRVVELDGVISAIKPEIKEFAEQKKFLQSIADQDGEANQPVEISGSHGNKVVYSAKCDETVITDKNGLLAALKAKFVEANGGDKTKGYEALLEFVDVPVGKLDKILSPVELAKFVVKTKATGPRKLTAVVKGQE